MIAFNAGAQVFVLIGQDYEVKFADVTKNTAFSKLLQHFLKTRDVLMLIIMSSTYPCQHPHHRNPLNETFQVTLAQFHDLWMDIIKILILLHCFISVKIFLTKSYDNTYNPANLTSL